MHSFGRKQLKKIKKYYHALKGKHSLGESKCWGGGVLYLIMVKVDFNSDVFSPV